MTTWAIVVAAGSGDRFGGAKQYATLEGRRVLDHSLEAARAHCDGVVLVVAREQVAAAEPGADIVVAGGRTRSASVRAGLDALPDHADRVLVHDAARPWAGPTVWRRVIEGLDRGADAVVPAVPVVDTLREIDGGTVDRGRFVAVQTPQGFPVEVLRRAHAGEPDASDDASLVEAAGGMVLVVDGDPANRKITTRADL